MSTPIDNPKDIYLSVNSVKLIAMVVMRNNGYGRQRLRKFSNDFDEILQKVLSEKRGIGKNFWGISELSDLIYDETGLKMSDYRVDFKRSPKK